MTDSNRIDPDPDGGSGSSRELELQIEQERTKQLQFRLENTQKTIELLQLTARLGVQPQELASLLALTGGSTSGNSDRGRGSVSSAGSGSGAAPPQQFKFPATNSTRSASPARGRVHSPARIGAQAVASLAYHPDGSAALSPTSAAHPAAGSNVTIKEEPTSPRSQVKLATFHNYTSSAGANNAVPGSFAHNSQARHIGHSRNMSLPSLSKFAQDSRNIPPTMTSILSFNNVSNNHSNSTELEKPSPSHPAKIKILGDSNGPSANPTQWRTHKKHRRARSASGFGVIDLNVIDEAKRKAIISSILSTTKPLPPLKPMPKNTDSHTVPVLAQPSNKHSEGGSIGTAATTTAATAAAPGTQPREDFDERTCSETSSSSRCASPAHYVHTKTHTASSVQQLLND